MTYQLPIRYEEITLEIVVKTAKLVNLRLIVEDAKHPDTVFTNRTMEINGEQLLKVRMPLSPNVALIHIYDDKAGNKPVNYIEVLSIRKTPLQKRMDRIDMDDPVISGFVYFAQKFAYNAGHLAPRLYVYGNFKIDYLPSIPARRTKSGRIMGTPAQTSMSTGRIEVSQEEFMKMTVPMRIVILLHEFSHFYMNSRIEDEEEADLNALLIYLSLGYPRIEAMEAFYSVFMETDTELNQRRYMIIKKFIENFENTNIIIE